MTIFYVMATRWPFLLGELGATSPMAVGAIMALMTAAAIPGALGYGRLRRHLSLMGSFALFWVGMAQGRGIVALALSAGVAAVGAAVMGLGGPVSAELHDLWMSAVPPALRGRTAGSLTTTFFPGLFASPLVTAPLALAQGALAVRLGLLALRERQAAMA